MQLDTANKKKLVALTNPKVLAIVEEYAKLCQPEKVSVITDSQEDLQYVRNLALENDEEEKLATTGHTIHFDGYHDQGRDKENTKVLLEPGESLGKWINTAGRSDGLTEIKDKLAGIMQGRELLVCFFTLGPLDSRFSIPALQITDSAYAAHSETILYRPGYETFRKLGADAEFYQFIHASGELEDGKSINIADRRIYIDLKETRVFALNTQYAGNSLGLKKLALRLAIKKANQSDWLCEHMFVMGAKPQGKSRTTYFTGAYPSACGKTSTAMLPGQSIIGDDIAYLRPGEDGRAMATNVEQGVFGIIEDVNPEDDPIIYKTLTSPREVIFSNILIKNNKPYWLGMGQQLPADGRNHWGDWQAGMIDDARNEVKAAHKNARYTVRIEELENVDTNLHNPDGVPVSGFIYGGRDSDTSPPVLESLDWPHGVFIGAILESETTATTLGKTGVRKHNPMANLEFLVVPLGIYIENHLKFGEKLDKPPKIFATNYFLKEDGKFLNGMLDKKVWLMWMEGRVHGEFEAIESPIGYLPKYEDLKILFRTYLEKDYSKEDYVQQFTIRIGNLQERLDRVEEIYEQEEGIPEIFLSSITEQRTRLEQLNEKSRQTLVSPYDL
jgi:phosphoenolpyruvate carboxykinase (GTP)